MGEGQFTSGRMAVCQLTGGLANSIKLKGVGTKTSVRAGGEPFKRLGRNFDC